MNTQSLQNELILASTSVYRQAMLSRLCVPFTSHGPQADETRLPNETATALTTRLAEAKANNIANDFPAAYVIGSDQVAECGNQIIGKPGSVENAVIQLMGFSNKVVNFHTSLAVMCKETDFLRATVVVTEVCFRHLDEAEVRRYVALDQPLDCAGSFKSEAAGPVLMKSMTSSDPTAIVGLPLIALATMLRDAGFSLP
jgi:septum formation protein